MFAGFGVDRSRKAARRAGLLALLVSALVPGSALAANGTLKVLKAGDRIPGQTSPTGYAKPVSGALFEWTTDGRAAAEAAAAGWTAFPSATNAAGEATVSLPPGIYYVRERTAGPGFSNFGPVRGIAFDPNSSTPVDPAYVAKVSVVGGQTTVAAPVDINSVDTSDWNMNGPGDHGSPFINVRDNAPFPTACALNVLLVLDRSAAMAQNKEKFRLAARNFIHQSADTPMQVGVISFSADDESVTTGGVNSYQDGSGDQQLTIAPRSLADAGSANEDAILDTIDRVYAAPSGGSNWDLALQKAAASAGFAPHSSTGQTTRPDLVIFLTGTNPTASAIAGSNTTGVDLLDVTAAMASANLVKNQDARPGIKTKLLVVATDQNPDGDPSVEPINVKAISGPTRFEDYELATVDQVGGKMGAITCKICFAQVNVRKRLETSSDDQAGWAFEAMVDTGHLHFEDDNNLTHSTPDGVQTAVMVPNVSANGTLVTISEAATGQPLSDFDLKSVDCRAGSYDGTPVTFAGTSTFGRTLLVHAGEQIFCTFTNGTRELPPNIDPRLAIVKKPATQALYLTGPGSTASYTYDVTNPGTSPVHDVVLVDDRCSPVSAPLKTFGGSGPDLSPATLDPGDVWTYNCSVLATTLFGNSTTPQTNVATVTGLGPDGRSLRAQATAVTTLLVPGIAIDKTVDAGSQTPKAGDTIKFNIAVTNTGNTSMVSVQMTDALCQSTLSAPDKGSDATPATLDPGEVWRYSCTVPTTAAQAGTTIVNSATVVGTDTGGRQPTATDDAQVPIGGKVGPLNPKGTAKLVISAGCLKGRLGSAIVNGSNIKSVTFYVDGRKVATVNRPNVGTNGFKTSILLSNLKYGSHKVRAVVTFVPGAEPASKTLSGSIKRCPRKRQVVKPVFPG